MCECVCGCLCVCVCVCVCVCQEGSDDENLTVQEHPSKMLAQNPKLVAHEKMPYFNPVLLGRWSLPLRMPHSDGCYSA